MSAYGGKADNHRGGVTSALLPMADFSRRHSNVRFVPIANIVECLREISASLTSKVV
jgi:hypothetical protein